MSGKLQIWIDRTEKKWLAKLQDYGKEIFSQTFLPSHDHTHHRRVWNICRSLLEHVTAFNRHLDPSLVEGLLIAVMFHDLGMAVTRDREHGPVSRELCEKYFLEKKLEQPERFSEVLDAIERHDMKDDRIYFGISPDEPPDLLTLLSLADDLEAMGTIGVYRYAEIYLARGMELKDLGIHILGNASTRFNHISKSCTMCPQIIRAYRQEYIYLVAFYDRFNQQLLVETEPENVRSGYIGIVNTIRRLSVEGRTRPEDFPAEIGESGPGKLVTDYFSRLKEDLQGERLQISGNAGAF